MSFSKVVIEKMTYALPPNIVRSEELEENLSHLYERLNLNIGRLELMTGIREEILGSQQKPLKLLQKQVLNYFKKETSTQAVLIYLSIQQFAGTDWNLQLPLMSIT